MKTKPTIGATLSFLVMSIIISFAFASTASAEPIRHKFGWQKIPAHCDQGTLRQQGYQLMTGAQCGYETQPCLNGSADGYAVRTTIKADVVYVCDKRGVPRWKHDCGNQIEVQEHQERVEQGQVVQQQSGFNLQEVFNGICTVAQYGLQLYQVGQSYGYQSQQYIQSCQYVQHRCEPTVYKEVTKTVNYYVDNSIHDSFNTTTITKINKTTTNPIICVTTPGQTGVGPIVDSGNSRTPVGDNGQIVSADGTLPYTTTKAAAKTAAIGTDTGNNPTGATGRNKPGQTQNLEVASATSSPQGAILADGTLDTANSRQAMRAKRNAATTTAAPAPAQTTATQTPTTTASIPPATTGGRVKKNEVASVAPAQTPTQTDAPQGALRRDGSLDTANTRRTSRANRTAETTTPASTTGQIASAAPAPAVSQSTVPQASTLKPSRKEARQASPVQPVSAPTTGQVASIPSAKTFSSDSVKPVGRTRGNNVGNIPNAKTFSQGTASTGSVPSVQSVPKATTFSSPSRKTSSGSIGSIPPASSIPKASSFSSGSTGGSGRIASNFSMPKQSSFTSTPRTTSGPSFSAPRFSGGNTGNLPTFGGGNNGGGGRNQGGKKGR